MSWIERLNRLKQLNKRNRRESGRVVPNQPFRPQTAHGQGPILPDSSIPRFRSIANDQIEGGQADRFGEIRMRLRNVFTPARPMTDRRVFAGRTEVLNTLIRAIEESLLHVVLYGERGLGKTSILHMLAEAARDARYLAIYVPCDVKSEFSEVFRTIATRIPLLFHGGIGPTAPETESGQTLAEVLPVGPLTARTVSDSLANVVGTRVIVILDEFDRCESHTFRQSVAELLKMLSDRAVRVHLVIGGVAGDLTDLLEDIPSAQRNVFAFQLTRMSTNEIVELVHNGEKATGLQFEAAAIDHVISIANGFPYFASLLCHYASLSALDNLQTTVTSDDVAAGLRSSLTEVGGRVARRSHLEISVCAKAGVLPALYELARVAQQTDGVIDALSIRQFAAEPKTVERCQRVIEQLLAMNILIRAVPDSSPAAYRFVDSNVPPYLWLKQAEEEFAYPSEFRDGGTGPYQDGSDPATTPLVSP